MANMGTRWYNHALCRSLDLRSMPCRFNEHLCACILIWQCVKTLVPLVNIKIAGKWMFIPLKMVLIAIDPYPVPVILKASPVFAGSLGAELKGSFGHSIGRPSRELPLRARLGFSCQNLRFEEPLIPTVLRCTCCFLGVNSKLWIIFLRATLQSVY